MDDASLLTLHRRLVEIPSVSKNEAAIVEFVEQLLTEAGFSPERIGRNVLVRSGVGPRLLLNSHLDTVPATSAWTREPHRVAVEGDRIYGLGSNDAKGAVAAMIAALFRARAARTPVEVWLLLVVDEETGGEGTELVWPTLKERGCLPDGVIVGEPTGLDLATSQNGMLILELIAEGDPCHAAHADRLSARNPIYQIAADLSAIHDVDLGPPHPMMGRSTMQPTVLRAGEARNQVPAEARCVLDLRTVPGASHERIIDTLQASVKSRVTLRSGRLKPCECPPDASILAAARRASPDARCYGSPTMSDMVFFDGVPAIKVGPGDTERSHRADEFILASEVLAGAAFYSRLIEEFAKEAHGKGGSVDVAVVG